SVLGHPVLELHRTRIGCLADTGLTPGGWRKLRRDEVDELRDLIRRCAGETAAPAEPADPEPAAPAARPAAAAFVVAIDGPAGSGKTSVARAVAERFGFSYFNTGASVRAVALAAMRQDLDLDDGASLRTLAFRVILDPEGRVFLDGEDVSEAVRAPEVSAGASRVAVHPELREVLVERWRQFAAGGGVVEGRDIGTVVFPEAPVKVFLDARPEIRAQRRSSDEGDRDVGAVQSELNRRDHTDSGRAVAPLRRAEDAHHLDTSDLTLEETVERVAELVEAARSRALD
ncbi:MAG: (d)CMP kinase, partial [Acidobacteriota bacterium]|nr:(d)CMP kinase [Acidobacteriota bacterium]